MKRKIIIVCLFSVFLLLLVPAMPAMEFNSIINDNKENFFEKMQNIIKTDIWKKTNGGIGLLELFIAFLLFIYIQLGIIFDRSFTLILLLADILYEIGLRLGLIDPNNLHNNF
jgi:hypothetical protein